MNHLDDDPEFRELLARQRRYGFRRAIRMGFVALAVAAAGAAAIAYGRSLDAAQAHSEVRFAFPWRMQLVGGMLVGVGVIAAAVSFVLALRLRVRRGL